MLPFLNVSTNPVNSTLSNVSHMPITAAVLFGTRLKSFAFTTFAEVYPGHTRTCARVATVGKTIASDVSL